PFRTASGPGVGFARAPGLGLAALDLATVAVERLEPGEDVGAHEPGRLLGLTRDDRVGDLLVLGDAGLQPPGDRVDGAPQVAGPQPLDDRLDELGAAGTVHREVPAAVGQRRPVDVAGG